MKLLTVILLLIACAASASAEPSADLEKQKAELLRIHKSDRETHFKTDVDKLLENSPEEFISVGRGKINRSTHDFSSCCSRGSDNCGSAWSAL